MLPIFGRSQGAKRRLDGVAGTPSPRKPQCYGQAWRHREGRKLAQPWWEERVPPLSRRELFGAPWKGEGPLPLTGVAPQLQPLEGMLLRRFTDIYPKELARDMREFFNSLLGHSDDGLIAGRRRRAHLGALWRGHRRDSRSDRHRPIRLAPAAAGLVPWRAAFPFRQADRTPAHRETPS